MNEWRMLVLSLLAVGLAPSIAIHHTPGSYERIRCKSREGLPFRPHSEQRHRLVALRDEMRIRASIEGSEIDAYIITSYDEHLNEDVSDSDKRRQYISGFTGKKADIAVTLYSSALWTDERYLVQADAELNCDWEIFNVNNGPSMSDWLAIHLKTDTRVGADPHQVPHALWKRWDAELSSRFIRLVKVNRNLVDVVWADRPRPPADLLQVHPITYAGEKWQSKIDSLRAQLVHDRCDAIIVTSLTEIAYLLNLRGKDLPHSPVFKAYLIVSHNDILLYTNSKRAKQDMGIQIHLHTTPCYSDRCVKVKDYDAIWQDVRTLSHTWRRVMMPSQCVFDLGASEAIYSSLSSHLIFERPSPIIFMRAQKNAIEREGMQRAHVLDGAAMCEALSLLERRFVNGDRMTEVSASKDVDLSRYALRSNKGTSYETIVAYGPHGSLPHFQTINQTDMDILPDSTVIVDSGGQYLEGTTAVTRTFHLGEPSAEQKKAYTNVLRGIIRLSTLTFPDNVKPSEVDALTRSPMWGTLQDYPQATGHGVGSYLAVEESPINIAYSADNQYLFKEGYFFSSEPAFYKQGHFGVRLKNVLEVIDTEKRHPSGAKFLRFKELTLVPYEAKLIDRSLLSTQEKRWLNEYNARIRDLVGEELKLQMNMQAFYWMMNKTRHIIEYYPESEYRKHNSSNSIDASQCVLVALFISLLAHLNVV